MVLQARKVLQTFEKRSPGKESKLLRKLINYISRKEDMKDTKRISELEGNFFFKFENVWMKHQQSTTNFRQR